MYIIAGLGNIGRKYNQTRHNVGFMAVDELADKCGIKIKEKRFKGLIGTGMVGGKKALLLKPETYMNLSGESIIEALRYYQSSPEDELIVLCDDIDLAPGRLRIRRSGSAGGHNGLKNIIENTKTQDFMRVRIGVGARPSDMDLADYVLGHFSREDKKIIADSINRASDAVIDIIMNGIDDAMNKYNRNV